MILSTLEELGCILLSVYWWGEGWISHRRDAECGKHLWREGIVQSRPSKNEGWAACGRANSARILVVLAIAPMPDSKKAESRITLPEAQARSADDVRVRLAQIGIYERDVTAAVSWARKVTSKA